MWVKELTSGFLLIAITVSLTKDVEGAFQKVPIIEYTNDSVVLVEKWNHIEKTVQGMVQSLIKQALPVALRLSYEIEISDQCNGALLQLVFGIRDMKEWAVRMLDAMGKPGGGQLIGTFANLGSYKECMALKGPSSNFDQQPIRGKYCLLDFRPPMPPKPKVFYWEQKLEQMGNYTAKTELFEELTKNMQIFYTIAFRMGICVPSPCSDDDVGKIANYTAKYAGLQVMTLPCETPNMETPLYTDQMIVILVIVLFVGLTVTATIAEHVPMCRGSQSALDKKGKSVCVSLVNAFSLRANTVKVLAPSAVEDDTFSCLNGMRFLSMGWVILIHTYGLMEPNLYRDGNNANEYSRTVLFQIVTNSALSVDTFFFVTGLLVAYQIVKLVDLKGMKVFNIPILVFKRIWRLLPSAMMILGLGILMPLFGYGPIFKDETDKLVEDIRKNWWRNLLFISNFNRFEDQGLAHLWYISVDMQCFLLAMVFLFLFFKNPRLGLSFNFLLIVASVVISGIVTYVVGLLPTFLMYAQDRTIFNRNITFNHGSLHAHVGSYAIGMWLGVTMARKSEFVIPRWLKVIGWPTILICQSILVFSTWWWNRGVIPTVLESVIYSSIHKIAWSISLAWITTMCATGNAGYMNSFLSWSVFIPLNRISYLVYLVHLLVVTYFFSVANGSMDAYHIFYVWVFIGNVTISHGMAFLMRIFYEAPLMELEKLAMSRIIGGGARRKRRSRSDSNGNPIRAPSQNGPDVENQSVKTCVSDVAEKTRSLVKENNKKTRF